MKTNESNNLIIRYGILILLSLANLAIFYAIFTPLTIYPVLGILKLFGEASLIPTTPTILFNTLRIEIIEACIGGAAYYLLLILNLTTPMNIKKRMNSILFLFLSFLILNILRITFFSLIFYNGYSYFDLAHKMIWYFGSTIMVIIIWFVNIIAFRIKEVPIYTDVKNILSNITPN